MVLDLKHIFVNEGSSLAVNFELDLSGMDFYGVQPFKKPIAVTGSVYNRAGIVTVDVCCVAKYFAPCDRCGCDTTVEHKVEVKRVLVSQLADNTDDEIIEIADMQLDITALCTDEVVLSLPMKHLCKEDCKGICQTCGKNLNEGECGCKSDTQDPRLSVLAQLLKG